jgi:spermidine synthase
MQQTENFLNRHKWQLIVLCSEFVYMGLELVASRLLAPSFGTTLDVWSAIIGTILLSSACGNWIAGKYADDKDSDRVMGWALVIAAIWLALTPTIAVGMTTLPFELSHTVSLFATCIAMFSVSGVAVGMLCPLAVSLHAREAKLETGAAASELYAACTIGGLAGTLITGFVLVPMLGSHMLTACLSMAMLALFAIVAIMGRKFSARECTATLIVWGISISIVLTGATESSNRLNVWKDTQYGRVQIEGVAWSGKPARMLHISGGFESAAIVEDGHELDLLFDYTKVADQVVSDRLGDSGSVLVMGGGAYSLPCAFAARGYACDVAEIDKDVTQIARDYFSLSKWEGEGPGHVRTLSGDARVTLTDMPQTTKYDVILNDTFAGNEPARTLTTTEAARLVHDRLTDNGIYVSNIIGPETGAADTFLGWELKTLKEVFKNVHVLRTTKPSESTSVNWIVIATNDDNWSAPQGIEEAVIDTATSEVLTDDHCPVEALVAAQNTKDRA